uniref:Uncharacterized protein n=1 Tax=Anguilla anguilla TaxID=7936 RepID=A0A0E9RQH9_ANGAN
MLLSRATYTAYTAFYIPSIYTAGYLMKQFGLSIMLKGTMAAPYLGIRPTASEYNSSSLLCWTAALRTASKGVITLL